MSRNNIIKENNKKLFESRLQMKPKLGTKRNQISFEQKRYNDNLSLLNNSQPFSKVIIPKQLKNHSTLENSFLNNFNNNSLINKKVIKINKKNRQKTQNLNINVSQNKSNVLIKDITFFNLKKSPKNNEIHNKTLINVNKKNISKQNSNFKNVIKQTKPKTNRVGTITLNIKKSKNNNRNLNVINSLTRSMTTINETNNNITINNSNYIMNNTNININNINNGNNRVFAKENLIPKFKLSNDIYIKMPNKSYKANINSNRNDSNSLKKINGHNSFLMNKMQKLQKMKIDKKPNMNNHTNFSVRLNDEIFGTNLNKGRNSLNFFKGNTNNNNNTNKNTIDICKGFTQRNLFLGKYLGKLIQKGNNKIMKYSNNNSRQRKQNRTLNFENYYYNNNDICFNNISNTSSNNNSNSNRYATNINNSIKNNNNNNNAYFNGCLYKDYDKKINKNTNANTSNNIVNKATAYNKKKIVSQKSYHEELNKNNNNYKFINFPNNSSHQDKELFSEDIYLINNNILNYDKEGNEFKDIDKTEQIIEENMNGISTKINDNDEFLSSEKNNIINETSVAEDSGILSMNEVQDIIHYNNMCKVSKEDNYLFNDNDYNIFVGKNKEKIFSKFFDEYNKEKDNYFKVKTKKKYIFFKENSTNNNKDFHHKNYFELKFNSRHNSSKKKSKL